MQIRRVRIERYRGIEELVLHPRSRTVLVGPNNAGKSTILEALDLLLHSGAGRPRPAPTEIDYFDRDTSRGFRIEAVLGALDDATLAEATDALEGWNAQTRDVTPEPDGDGIEPILRVEVTGTPDLELIHAYAKPEVPGMRFGRPARSRIGWVFDGRSREPSRQLAFYQGGLLDQLFAGLDLAPAVQELRTALAGGADRLNLNPVVASELRAIRAPTSTRLMDGARPISRPAGLARELQQSRASRCQVEGRNRFPCCAKDVACSG